MVAEPGRRSGRRAKSSTAFTPRRASCTTTLSLSATRCTATSQPFCSVYRVKIPNAIIANPTANSAKAASSSCTKYSCNATSAPRNHHIHFRPLSFVFIFPLFPESDPCDMDPNRPTYFTATSHLQPLRCNSLSIRSNAGIPVRFDSKAGPKIDGTQGTFLVLNEFPSTNDLPSNQVKANIIRYL